MAFWAKLIGILAHKGKIGQENAGRRGWQSNRGRQVSCPPRCRWFSVINLVDYLRFRQA